MIVCPCGNQALHNLCIFLNTCTFKFKSCIKTALKLHFSNNINLNLNEFIFISVLVITFFLLISSFRLFIDDIHCEIVPISSQAGKQIQCRRHRIVNKISCDVTCRGNKANNKYRPEH